MTGGILDFAKWALAGMIVLGCLPIGGPEEASDEFSDAIPLEEDLTVKIGQMDGETVAPAGILDPYAVDGCDECCIEEIDGEEWYVDGDLYQLTRDAKWFINGGLVLSMGWVWAVVSSPATRKTDSGYIWGPWHESLSRIEFRFVMDKKGENEFAFELEGRNINETADEWTDIVVGEVRSTGTPHAVAGTLSIDYSAVHAIDSAHSVPFSGTISYTYDVTKFPYSVDCEFEAFEYEPGRFLDATYSYRRLDENMSGELTFDMVADLWPEEKPDGQDETLVVESKWNANGKGRAEAVMSGGTLELEGSVVERGILEECWADSAGLFYSTYQSGTIEYSDGTPAETLPGCGEPEHCPEIIPE